MLPRTAQRLETTLLVSRQSLPRPARLLLPTLARHRLQRPSRHYSTPSKPAHAPSTATAQLPPHEFPAYMHHSQPSPVSSSSSSSSAQYDTRSNVLSPFLSRMEYTILPAPLPTEEHKNDPIFVSTTVQDRIAVMDACIRNLHNVSRARTLFNHLRKEHKANLHVGIYNNILTAYLETAKSKEVAKTRQEWILDMRSLFTGIMNGKEGVKPDESTFAIMLTGAHSFPNEFAEQAKGMDPVDISILMNLIAKTGIDIVDVVASRTIPDESAPAIVKQLSETALQYRNIDIVNKLAKATAIASGKDTGLPEAVVATKPTKDGSVPEVPFNIQNLRDHLVYVAYAREILPNDLVARQRHLELSAYDMEAGRAHATQKTLGSLGIDNRFHDTVLQEQMFRWHGLLEKRLEQDIARIEKEEDTGRIKKVELSPYLALVKPSRLSMIAILETMRLSGSGGIASGMKTTRALVSVGKAVEMEYKARVCRSNKIPLPDNFNLKHGDYNIFSETGYKYLYERRLAAAKQMSAGESWTAPWSQITRAQLGAILLEALMDVAKITRTSVNPETGEKTVEEHPAFYHSYEYCRGTKLGVIKVNPVVSDRIARDQLSGTIHPRHLPMLHPPKPWLGPNDGGYHLNKAHLMRFKDSVEQEKHLHEAVRNGQMEYVLSGLNALGQTAWRINKDIFDVVLQVWNSGEQIGKLPAAVLEDPEPQPPSDVENDVRARSVYIQRHKLWLQNVANNHSERCSTNYKIEIARTFLNDTIYFPHNLDFRGRAYPLPPHLNHIGDDLSRGLLMFQEVRPLKESGFRWLKIHLANLYGFDKADFNERVEWVHKRVDEIKDSAKNPLTGRGWWKKADDPWQCLAACMELTAALESADPTAYLSHLPVHQDGTCNGLQHYAAMGGDATGAQQVNLAASDRPSDVYTFIGNKVEKLIIEDAAKGNPHAQILIGKITRKVVKQTVMTTVYGVTFVGARDQIEGQLKDRGDIPTEDCWNVAGYLAKKVLTTIGDTFNGARTIQTWLNLCARLISKSISPERFIAASNKTIKKSEKNKNHGVAHFKKEQMTSVIWTTVLGLPVVQPYRKTTRKQIMTNIQSVFISDPNIPNEVNAVKQASAFPPNFVHSLDATHMLLTSLGCNKAGLTFASVHDSYWTHACDVNEMSEIIRDTFIELHTTDVLGRLEKEFKARYKGYLIPIWYLQGQPQLQQRLYDAGTRIKIKPEQAKMFQCIEKLCVITEDGKSSIEELDLVSLPTAKQISETQEQISKAYGEEEGGVAAAKEAEPASSSMHQHLLNKFLDISDLFPPLPEKGSFDVNDIKKSTYFFS